MRVFYVWYYRKYLNIIEICLKAKLRKKYYSITYRFKINASFISSYMDFKCTFFYIWYYRNYLNIIEI